MIFFFSPPLHIEIDVLFRNRLELRWRVDKPLAGLVCELKDRDEVADAEAKAHGGLGCSVVVAVSEGALDSQ
jgi:hypothetical protein